MKDKSYDVAIVGAGPAGLNAAFILASQGGLKVAVLDQGNEYNRRVSDDDLGKSDLLRGIGGAGTLNGGKLCGIPASLKLWRKTWYALPNFYDFLASLPLPSQTKKILAPNIIDLANNGIENSGELISKNYPTALLLRKEMRSFIRGIYYRAKLAGCKIMAQQTVTDIRPCGNSFTLDIGNGDSDYICANTVILATGRSSANSIENLLSRTLARVQSQSPDLGIRLSIPNSASDLFVNYGEDLKIKQQMSDTVARTFCVCTGGDSAIVNIDNVTYVDGHYSNQLTKSINTGIVARSSKIVGYQAAHQYAIIMGEMIGGGDMTMRELLNYLPRFAQNLANGAFQEPILGIQTLLNSLIKIGGAVGHLNDCEVVGATIDRYWPYIQTNHFFETPQPGLFVVGDCTGISRGYIQSMWSAQCAALAIIKRMHGSPYNNKMKTKEYGTCTRDDQLVTIAA